MAIEPPKRKERMITLEYFNGKEWVFAGEYQSNYMAWAALGDDYENHRTVDQHGKVIMER